MKELKKKIKLEAIIKFFVIIAMAFLYLTNNENIIETFFTLLLVVYAIYTIFKAIFSRKDFTLPVLAAICLIYLLFLNSFNDNFNIISLLYLFILIEGLNNLLSINRYRKRIKYSFLLKISQYALIIVAIFFLYTTLTGKQENLGNFNDLFGNYVKNINNFLNFVLLVYTAISTLVINFKVNKALKKLEKAKEDYDKEINKEQA